MSGCISGTTYRYKNKNVSEKVFRHRQKLRESCLLMHQRKTVTKKNEAEEEEALAQSFPVQGRRIVDINLLAQHLQCLECKEILSLKYIESETRMGLASLFKVRCHHCLAVRTIPSSKRTTLDKPRGTCYNVNSEAVLGAQNAGMGVTRINKLLVCLNLPVLTRTSFKRYERIVNEMAENEKKAAQEESLVTEKKELAESLVLTEHIDIKTEENEEFQNPTL